MALVILYEALGVTETGCNKDDQTVFHETVNQQFGFIAQAKRQKGGVYCELDNSCYICLEGIAKVPFRQRFTVSKKGTSENSDPHVEAVSQFNQKHIQPLYQCLTPRCQSPERKKSSSDVNDVTGPQKKEIQTD
jgi:hypothetical protein